MAHDLHADPEVLRAARLAADDLGAALRPEALDPGDLAVLTTLPGGAALVAEHDRLLATVAWTRGELAELATALGIVATALESADRHAMWALTGGDR